MRERWLDVIQILDSSFPTGGYVHSFGLESLPSARSSVDSVLRLRVEQSLARLELVFLRYAYRTNLRDLDAAYHAMLLVREPREASAAIGTNLLKSVADVLTDTRLEEFLLDGPHRHHPVAFGAIAAAVDLPPDLAAGAYAFGSVRGQVMAAQRLGWIGQRDAQRILAGVKGSVWHAVDTAMQLDLENVGAFVPAWDIACMLHERAAMRMFAS